MESIYRFISPETVYALGIMLIHFLWQALVLALFLGLFLLFTRKASPVPRYYAAVFSLFMMPLMAIYTFIDAFRSIEVAVAANRENAALAKEILSDQSLFDKFLGLYTSYIPVIVFLWFIGITALLLKNLGGLILIQRLKNYYIEPVSDAVRQMVEQIKIQYLIRKIVKPLISTKVNTPMVIGHFKPVVLIPAILAQNLTPEEMRVVLQHELAHIKRNDFLINIFQLVVEALFFFHPATWWISHIARQEREECCDAFAAQTGDEKIILAKALTSIQEYKLKSNSMAVALLNNKSGLYNRIKSMFGNRPSSPSFREGVIVTLFVFASLVFMSFVVITNTDDKEKKQWKTVHTELSNGDYVYAKIDSIGSIRELFVNGEKVRKSRYPYYQNKLDSIQMHEEFSSGHNRVEYTSDEKSDEHNYDEMEKVLERLEGDVPLFRMKAGDNGEKVDMSASNKGFKLHVNDGKDEVKMDFGEKGAKMTVKENGKTTFEMNIGLENLNLNIDTVD